jgi:NADPH:quinone reductase-like Zn-dependent oxidoreductase
VPVPQPGAGQVRIRVVDTDVNPFDWKVRSGAITAVQEFPAGVAGDAAGIIDAVGSGVTDFKPGDPVFGFAINRGGDAEFAVLNHWARKPDSMSWAEAVATTLASETGLTAVRGTGAKKGDRILIDGAAGSVGLAATQLAIAQGIEVVGTASEKDFDLLRQVGATPVQYGPGIADRAREFGPFAAVIDLSGRVLDELVTLVDDPAKVVGMVNHQRGAELGVTNPRRTMPHAYDALDIAAKLSEEGHFIVRIGPSFPMSQTGEAQLASQNGAKGKVIITVSEP